MVSKRAVISAKRVAKSPVVITLGTLGVEGLDSDASSRLLSQPKRVAVLLYLLLSPRGSTVSRDRMLGVFWPESDASRARNALRQTLSFLRSCLGEDAVLGIGAHGLAIGNSIECDAVRFEELLDANRSEQALRLYRGELLTGFHLDESNEFGDWLDGRRKHLNQRAAKAAWDLSAASESAGDAEAAAFWGKRALALSPFSESEVQRLIRLLGRVGDYSGALRAFHGLQGALHTEFGARPAAETTRLAAEIREKLESEAIEAEALVSTRRAGADRRVNQRRVNTAKWTGKERRRSGERRKRQRRSGLDRRELR
jgi:DNA-binding SARP family transcriptional activator